MIELPADFYFGALFIYNKAGGREGQAFEPKGLLRLIKWVRYCKSLVAGATLLHFRDEEKELRAFEFEFQIRKFYISQPARDFDGNEDSSRSSRVRRQKPSSNR